MQQEEQDQIRDAHYAHLNEYRGDPAYQAVRSYEDRAAFFAGRVGTRWEINQAIYEEFLDLLPPLGWGGDRFYLSEFLFDGITHKFSKEGERFFCEVACYPPRPSASPEHPGPTGKPLP